MDRGLHLYILKRPDTIGNFSFGDVGSCFHGNNRQPSALHANGGGDDTGGIGAFLSCIGLASGAGIACYPGDLPVFKGYGKCAA